MKLMIMQKNMRYIANLGTYCEKTSLEFLFKILNIAHKWVKVY